MKQLTPLLGIVMLIVTSCTPSPKSIDYGSDMCYFCKMTIVDQQHAAEVVTDKGKVFMFDAIECMANYIEQERETNFAFVLVNDFDTPKSLIDAHTSHYLISPNLPSPMGAFLTAFADENSAKEMQKAKGGELFNWENLQTHLKEEGVVRYSNN